MNIPEGWRISVIEDEEQSWLRLDSPRGQSVSLSVSRGTMMAETLQDFSIAILSAAPTPPEVDKDEAYKAAWVDGFESRQGEIDSLGAELLREKNIAVIRGPRPEMTVYTEKYSARG